MAEHSSDPDDLGRFVAAQAGSYQRAVLELRAGKKRSHWMWYIFPQVVGLGSSSMAQRYAIHSRAEAEAYLAHPILRQRLIECAEAFLEVNGRSAREIMGYPDDLKLQSSMTLFAIASGPDSVFERVLQKYYDGARDSKTLERLSLEEADS